MITVTEFTLDLAKQLVSSEDEFPVLFDDAFVWLEYTRKDNAKRAFEKCGFIEGVDFKVLLNPEVNPQGGRPTEAIKLTTDCFKQWGMMINTEKGKQIRLYFLQCEKVAKQTVVIPTEVLQFMTSMQQQMQILTERTQQLDQVKEEKDQLNQQLTNTTNQLTNIENTLNTIHEAGAKHDGCYNIINSEINNTKTILLTAYEYLDLKGYDVEFANVLSRRTATFYRCSLKKEPYKNSSNITVFEERYLDESYKSLKELE